MDSPPLAIDNIINFNSSETFKIKVDEKDIKLKISFNNKIIAFEAEEKDNFPKKEFSALKSLEELIKIDKYFRQFDNLKEVFESIKITILNKNLSIIKEEKEIKLKISNPLTNKDFLIQLPAKLKDIKTQMENLIPYISSLNNKITNLENQISQMRIEFDNKLKEMEKKYQEELNKREENYVKKNEQNLKNIKYVSK